MTYEPFKCPDCKTWWRGETHRCEPQLTKDRKQLNIDDLDLCVRCGQVYNTLRPHKCEVDKYRKKPNPWGPDNNPKKPKNPYGYWDPKKRPEDEDGSRV